MRWKYAKLLRNLGNALEALCGHDLDDAELTAGHATSTRARKDEAIGIYRAEGIDWASDEEWMQRRQKQVELAPVEGRSRGGRLDLAEPGARGADARGRLPQRRDRAARPQARVCRRRSTCCCSRRQPRSPGRVASQEPCAPVSYSIAWRHDGGMTDARMPTRSLGRSGLTVSMQGLGCMGMSQSYGPADEKESIATIHRALDLGVFFLDTADIYGVGHNEELVGRAIRDRRDEVVLATKFSIKRDDGKQAIDGSPGLRAVCL